MTLDITHLKPGDKVRLRNGAIVPVAINEGEDAEHGMPIGLIHTDDRLYWYYPTGKFHEICDSEYDIIEILPTPKRNLRDLLVKTETTYGSELATDDSIPQIKSIHLEEPSRPTPFSVTGRNLIIATGLGVQQFASIECNGKLYVPVGTSGPFALITRPNEGVIAIRYQGQLFTPADAWPEPIRDRAPTKEDADEDGDIQRYSMGGWHCEAFNAGFGYSEGWAHTPIWKSRPTPALSREEVIDILKDGAIFHNSDVEPDLIDSILTHLEANV